jgi:hypothetical protein
VTKINGYGLKWHARFNHQENGEEVIAIWQHYDDVGRSGLL